MENLVYGVVTKDDKDDKDDKRDKKKSKMAALMKLDKEFEELRIKLYPTSSTDPAMNAVVGQLYGNAIQRGDRYLYAETLRFLGTNDEPSLAEWKLAAASAYTVRQNFAAAAATIPAANRPNPGYKPRWGQASRPTGATVNEMGEGETEEGGAEGWVEVGAHQVEGRSSIRSRTSQSGKGFRLPDDVFAQVRAKQLCLQCYKPGHRIGDSACPEKGQPRRKPAPGELSKA
jgi:hypothetical protein